MVRIFFSRYSFPVDRWVISANIFYMIYPFRELRAAITPTKLKEKKEEIKLGERFPGIHMNIN